MNYSVTIDVPGLDEGLRFYRDALGFVEVARPVATHVILDRGDAQIGLMEPSSISRPTGGYSSKVSAYGRHARGPERGVNLVEAVSYPVRNSRVAVRNPSGASSGTAWPEFSTRANRAFGITSIIFWATSADRMSD